MSDRLKERIAGTNYYPQPREWLCPCVVPPFVHGMVPQHTLEYPPLCIALLCVYMHLSGVEAREVKMRIAGTNCYVPLQLQTR